MLNHIADTTIRIENVPINYDVNLLIKYFANFTFEAISSN